MGILRAHTGAIGCIGLSRHPRNSLVKNGLGTYTENSIGPLKLGGRCLNGDGCLLMIGQSALGHVHSLLLPVSCTFTLDLVFPLH